MDLTNLKEELSLIKDDIFFDPSQYLREKTSNPSKIKQVIIKAEKLLELINEDKLNRKEEKYFLYGTLGNLYRIYDKPKIAIRYLELSLRYSIDEKNCNREIISLIRLGEALKYDNKLDKSLEIFDEALIKSTISASNSYKDFALQHKGKCLLELKRVEEAIKCFQEAVMLRIEKNNQSLIVSTLHALDFARTIKH
ncbi:hypothetical protein [Psychrobacillus sp. L4]|uniref:hypothetical protein n=1 Tax=Psychrobacillus sp. L4 TaxID=3236892 RepID=UPI0036F2B9B9